MNQEAAGRTQLGCGFGHRRMRPELATVPTLGSAVSPIDGQHTRTPQADFPAGPPTRLIAVDDGIDLVGTGQAGDQTGIVRRGWQHISHSQITGEDAITPGDPVRCNE